ncbi:metallophosphoesterase [Lysobacter sp. FW306-1B-D06B]|uniref:metallophosphoesterase n=1 Tax=Lysobacter sp. FW306-1B-D06B TaxID=3140250 RepID=UPI003140B72B
MSDLHREVWFREETRYEGQVDHFPVIDPLNSRPDVVVLAGDIDMGDRAVVWAEELFRDVPVLYVHGNHEAYGRDLQQLHAEIDVACSRTNHVRHLNRTEVVIGNTRFLGATLWTDFRLYGDQRYAEAVIEAGARMNDYRRIRRSNRSDQCLQTSDTESIHRADVAWLEAALSRPFNGSTVVITHMAPSRRSVAKQYRGMELSAAFASNLDHLVERTDLWIHGHTHSPVDYQIGQGRVVCNPLGYPNRASGRPDNLVFDPNFVINV